MPTSLPRRLSKAPAGKPSLALIETAGDALDAAGFDAGFYLHTYPDVAAAQGDPLEHYRRHGRAELRYANPEALEADIRAVEASGLFDAEVFQALYGRHDDPVRQFLVNYRFGPLRPNAGFDGAFVAAYYRRSLRPGENPFLFYCRHRDRPWCYQSMTDAASAAEILARSPLFDAAYYRANHLAGREGMSPELDYLTEGFRLLHDPSARFSTAAYLYDSPDIVTAQMNPLLHYECGGRAEARPTACGEDLRMLDGGMRADPARRTLLLVSHQVSRTGAPILALNLLRRLSARFNVVSLLLEGGALLEDFTRLSCAAVVSGMRPGQIEVAVQEILRGRSVDCALLNTVVAVHAIEPLARRGVPVLTLIHDFAQHTRPMGLASRAVVLSDRVVYPAETVRAAALVELGGLLGVPARPANTEIRAQGRCLVPSSAAGRSSPLDLARTLRLPQDGSARPLVVLGAGHVELRKGVDLFIDTARLVRDDLGVDCRFVWIGGGYDPDADAVLSAYLEDQVRKSGLEGCVVFVPAQDSLDPWMEAADAFYMSSRLDPFPNVVLDALAQGLPVVCFDKATGVAELAADFPELIRAAPYLRTAAAASLLVEMGRTRRGGKPRPGDKKLQRRLDFEPYAGHVCDLLDEVMAAGPRRQAEASALLEGDRFDPAHFAASVPPWLVSPLARAGPTQAHLARLAARIGACGLPVGGLQPGVLDLAGDGEGAGRYPSIGLAAARPELAADVIIACAEEAWQVRDLAGLVFRAVASPQVVVISATLTAGDLAPLKAILPRGHVRLTPAPAGEGASSLAPDLAAQLKPGAVVQLVRFPPPPLAPWIRPVALDPRAGQAACAAFAEHPELRLVLAHTPRQDDPPRLFAEAAPALEPLPAHLVDQRQCWLRADDPGFARVMIEALIAGLTEGRMSPWGSSGAPAAPGWAIVEPEGAGHKDYGLTWGRDAFDPQA